MKSWSTVTVAALLAVWLIAITMRDFFDALGHFSSQPRDLFYVLAVAITCGLATLLFVHLSVRAQGHVRVFLWGAAASSLTLFVCLFGFRLASLSSLVIENGGTALVVLVLLLFAAVAFYFWFEFYRAWKTRLSR